MEEFRNSHSRAWNSHVPIPRDHLSSITVLRKRSRVIDQKSWLVNSKSDKGSRIAWEGSGIAPLRHREPLSHLQSTMIPAQCLSLSAANTPTSGSLDSQFSEQGPSPFTDTCFALSNGKIPHAVLIYLVKVSTRE